MVVFPNPDRPEFTIEYLMNCYALSFLNRQHSTNIQYSIDNIQSMEDGACPTSSL